MAPNEDGTGDDGEDAQEGSTRGQGPGQGHIGPVLPGSHGDRRSTLDVAGDRDVDLMWGVDLARDVTQSPKLWGLFGTQGPVEPGKV